MRHVSTAGWLSAALLSGASLAIASTLVQTQEAQPPKRAPIRVLYPATRSVYNGPVRVIIAANSDVTGVTASLDGKPLKVDKLAFASAWKVAGRLKATSQKVGERENTTLWLAEVKGPTGVHTLKVGDESLEIRMEKGACEGLPPDWSIVKTHPALGSASGKDSCADCHNMTGKTLGAVATASTCGTCHDDGTIQKIHNHAPKPLAKCGMCHDPHGSPRAKLLTDSKDKLCVQCHAAGHSKP